MMALMQALQMRLRDMDERLHGGEALRLDIQARLLRQEERTARAEQEVARLEVSQEQERVRSQAMERQLHNEVVARQGLENQMATAQADGLQREAQLVGEVARLQASQEQERARVADLTAHQQRTEAKWQTHHQRLEERLEETRLGQGEQFGTLEAQQEEHEHHITELREIWPEGLKTMQESMVPVAANTTMSAP